MSSNPEPLIAAPFIPAMTPAMERANRLISVRSHPGSLDILRVSQEIVDTATKTLVQYPGWDPQQVMVLKVRAQAADEHHALLIAKINDAILEGIKEGREQSAVASVSEKTAEESVDQGDFVRQELLKRFEETDMRTAGSY